MALHNLKITVYDGGKRGGGENTENKTPENSEEKVKQDAEKKNAKILKYAKNEAVSFAKSLARQGLNYYISDIGRAHGDNNYQAMVNRQIEIASDAYSVVSGFVSGLTGGASIGGPVGAAIGAVLGIAGSAVNLTFKYAQRERTYAHEMFQENTSQAYNLARANYTALTGRVR